MPGTAGAEMLPDLTLTNQYRPETPSILQGAASPGETPEAPPASPCRVGWPRPRPRPRRDQAEKLSSSGAKTRLAGVLEKRREKARQTEGSLSPPGRAACGPRWYWKPRLKWRPANCLNVAHTSAPGALHSRPSHPHPQARRPPNRYLAEGRNAPRGGTAPPRCLKLAGKNRKSLHPSLFKL